MPRLSADRCLQLYAYLRNEWLTDRLLFSYLPTQDQYYLHRYFRLSHELSRAELLAHRRQVTAEQPSLPHCAGRAVHRLLTVLNQPGRHGRLTVYPLVRPDPDVRRLAKAVWAVALRLK